MTQPNLNSRTCHQTELVQFNKKNINYGLWVNLNLRNLTKPKNKFDQNLLNPTK